MGLAARRLRVNGFLRLALHCARNVFDATDRRMPEARALADWVGQSAAAFGLADADLPNDEASFNPSFPLRSSIKPLIGLPTCREIDPKCSHVI
jgi:hypothetical protein